MKKTIIALFPVLAARTMFLGNSVGSFGVKRTVDTATSGLTKIITDLKAVKAQEDATAAKQDSVVTAAEQARDKAIAAAEAAIVKANADADNAITNAAIDKARAEAEARRAVTQIVKIEALLA